MLDIPIDFSSFVKMVGLGIFILSQFHLYGNIHAFPDAENPNFPSVCRNSLVL